MDIITRYTKIITRYTCKEILYYFMLFTAFCTVIMLTYEAYDSREIIVQRAPSVFTVALFLLCSLPEQLVDAMPIVGLMSTIFAYGILAKNREILAMVAAGVSFRRLSIPAFIFGIGLMGFAFLLNEFVVPETSYRARLIEKGLRGSDKRNLDKRSNLFEKGENNRFYLMQGYITSLKLMLFPTVIDLDPEGSGVVRRIDADRAAPVGDSARGKDFWEFTNAERRTFNSDGTLQSFDRFKSLEVQMENQLDVFLSKSKEPEEMNFGALLAYIQIVRGKIDKSVIADLEMSLHKKIAFPVATLLMVILGFAVVVDVHARHFTQGVALGLVVAVSYYILNAALNSFGQQQWLNPFFAGWGSVMIFGVIDYLLYLRLSKIRL